MRTLGIGQLRVVLPVAALAVGAAACGGGSSYASKASSSGASSGLTASAPATSSDAGGNGKDNSYGYGSGGAGTSGGAAGAAQVKVTQNGKLGQILVDGAGRSLYLFEKDKGSTSSCYSDCAKVWPPFISSGAATGGTGATSSLLGTTSRTDGTKQVTYHGHPLYYYVSDDHTSGSTTGEGLNQFGAEWYVLSPTGSKVEKGGS